MKTNTAKIQTPKQERPRRVPPRIFLVIQPNGGRHFVDHEFLDSTPEDWAKNSNVELIEFRFEKVIHAPR